MTGFVMQKSQYELVLEIWSLSRQFMRAERPEVCCGVERVMISKLEVMGCFQ